MVGAFDGCSKLAVYTNNDYVVDFCEEEEIPVKSLKTNYESYIERNRLKLQIRE